jgi:hypothetical protein
VKVTLNWLKQYVDFIVSVWDKQRTSSDNQETLRDKQPTTPTVNQTLWDKHPTSSASKRPSTSTWPGRKTLNLFRQKASISASLSEALQYAYELPWQVVVPAPAVCLRSRDEEYLAARFGLDLKILQGLLK